MKKLKRISYQLLSMFMFYAISQGAFAQTDNKIISATPEVSALAKSIYYPVSLNTGVADISIPLHNINVGGIQIPITLSYHASGIKANEQSTWVGLGWNLVPEPQINRSINGGDDFSGGYLSNSNIRSFLEGPATPHNIFTYNALANGYTDEQPDNFMYKLLSDQGSFMFQKYANNEYEALSIPYKPIKINYNGINGSFEIIDKEGRNYLFDIKENTEPNLSGSYFDYVSSWKCSRVISPSKADTVYFKYNPYRVVERYSFSERTEIIDSITAYGLRATINNYVYGVGYNGSTSYECPAANGTYIKTTYLLSGLPVFGFERIGDIEANPQVIHSGTRNFTLNEIDFRGGRVQLFSVPNGYAGNKLDSILVFDKSNRLVKRIRFYLRYTNPERHPGDQLIENNRLLLDSVIISAPQGSTREKYIFEYNLDEVLWMHPWSKRWDSWGYNNTIYTEEPIYGTSVPCSYNISVVDGNAPESFLTHYNILSIGGAWREPHEPAMKYLILKKIINPLGGKTEFEYSANKYMENEELKIAGGLRIEKISSFTSVNDVDPAMEKIYKYGENEDGAGEVKVPWNFMPYSYEQTMKGIVTDPYQHQRKRTFLNHSLEDLFYGSGNAVNYTTVTEYQKDRGTMTGKSVYKYNSGPRFSLNESGTDITQSEIEIKGRELISETKYAYHNGGYIWVNRDSLIYTLYERPYSIYIGKIFRKVLYASDAARQAFESLSDFIYRPYRQPVGCLLLSGKETQTRDLNNLANIITQSDNYYYDNTDHLQITRMESIHSDGRKEVIQTSYPLDYASGTSFIDNMKTSHLVTYPIERVKYLVDGTNQSIVSGTTTEYKTSGQGLPDSQWSLDLSDPIGLNSFKFSNRNTGELPPSGTPTMFGPDGRYTRNVTYDTYDDRANLLQYHNENNINTSCIWGYNKVYPVIKGDNVTYDILNAAVIAAGATNLETFWNGFNNITTDASQKTAWKNFNTALRSNATLSNAQVTTYTYSPLIGMTSQTDPNGLTTYFEYDSFGRLKNAKDKDQKILKHYQYHYYNEQ